MNKRYQVFISSTFTDLEEERQEVIQALLELDCIPAGMEIFPAADDDQWTLIQRVIDDCDYYVVIIGGRYGSVSKKTGLSYTEMEYRYAMERGKPVLGFIHENPGGIPVDRSERDESSREKLSKFRELVKEKMCKYWGSAKDLGGVVSRAMIKAIKSHPAVGWVRADQAIGEGGAQEILKLRLKIEELERELQTKSPPRGTEDLAQGDEPFEVLVGLRGRNHTLDRFRVYLTWNELFGAAFPQLLRGAVPAQIAMAIEGLILCDFRLALEERAGQTPAVDIDAYLLDTIRIQFEALGLIKSVEPPFGSGIDPDDYWVVTPYGREVGYRVRGVRRTANVPSKKEHEIVWEKPKSEALDLPDDEIPF